MLDKLASSQSKLVAAQNKLKTDEITTTEPATTTTKKVVAADKANKKNITNVEKQQQLAQRLEEEHNHRLRAVALKHFQPFLLTSFLFIILMRVLGTEHKNKIIGVVPFVPYRFIQRFLSLRGLQIDPQWFTANVDDASVLIQEILSNVNHTFAVSQNASGKIQSITSVGQVCSFTFIYMLTSMSVKYYMNQLFTTHPPKGAESYMTTMVDNPKMQQMVADKTGIDTKQFNKTE